MRLTKAQKAEFEQYLSGIAHKHWTKFKILYPELQHFEMPQIVLNNRLSATAGLSYQKSNRVELCTKFFFHSDAYTTIMIHEIIPHELAHQIDYNLFGECKEKGGHGKNWSAIMQRFGLAPKRYHRMERV